MSDAEDLLARAIDGDRRALGRLLTLVERGGRPADAVDRALSSRGRAAHAHVVGITGAPGAGKSTLTGALLDVLVARHHRPAVLAVDPSSPMTGGAILGDRIRMGRADTSAFIRSVATRGAHGGLATSVPAMVRVLEGAGYDIVVVETVGVGQIELDVAALADTTVVVVTPGWGDAVQANKAGLLEIADVLVVNKADRPGADDATRDLERMLDLAPPGQERPPVLSTVATQAVGVDKIADALSEHAARTRASSDGTTEIVRRRVVAEVRALVEREITSSIDAALDAETTTLADVESGRLPPSDAAARILRTITGRPTTAPAGITPASGE